ncbi:hypothetical protein LJY25_01130 [Hymenobacter sp. BT175]|uniref:hypothetical protein n=1 Tax=Hymenobacter translucens TaxID=2886507 RepID=UPI001D0F2620|nr:hypothetical protein [Hymenobacter translucens]MCC2545032.1 hypothetical protein [Hymenobacter translucens]
MDAPALTVPLAEDWYFDQQKVLPTGKFILICVITCGFYCIWWQYKAWRFIRQRQQLPIRPAFRALFSVFTIYSLLKEIHRLASGPSGAVPFSPAVLAAGFILTCLVSIIPGTLGLIGMLGPVWLIPAHRAFNQVLRTTNDVPVVWQSTFSGQQWLLLVPFGFLWLLILLGVLVMGVS